MIKLTKIKQFCLNSNIIIFLFSTWKDILQQKENSTRMDSVLITLQTIILTNRKMH